MEDLLKLSKETCRKCMQTNRLKESDKEQKFVLGALNTLYNQFTDDYNFLRKQDAPTDEIQLAFKNKQACLDAMTACKGCDKQQPLVAQNLEDSTQ